MQQPRLVASDVDGTLLPDGWVPTERTCAAVGRVLDGGTPFVLVSGRPPRWIPGIAQYLPGVRHAICANGAVRYDITDDRVYSARTLSPGQLVELGVGIDQALPGSWLATERVGDHALDQRGVPRVEVGYSTGWLGEYVEAPRAEVLAEPAIKLLIRHSELTSDQMLAALGERVGEEVTVTFSNPKGLLEVAPSGVSKATGLAELAAELGVEPTEVIAFGDMPNDVAMLRWAGHGVAMGNAHPDAIAAADEVTASNTADGVAQVLERWF